MIEAIQVAASGAAQAGPAASPATQPQATMFDLSRFADAYAQAGGQVGAAAGNAPAAPAITTEPSQGMRMLLSAFENLNGGAKHISQTTQMLSASSKDPTPSELLKMTMECHQFLFKAELTSNVANRTSDGIQQLFRQQS